MNITLHVSPSKGTEIDNFSLQNIHMYTVSEWIIVI